VLIVSLLLLSSVAVGAKGAVPAGGKNSRTVVWELLLAEDAPPGALVKAGRLFLQLLKHLQEVQRRPAWRQAQPANPRIPVALLHVE
jgi:hypothetical protein